MKLSYLHNIRRVKFEKKGEFKTYSDKDRTFSVDWSKLIISGNRPYWYVQDIKYEK